MVLINKAINEVTVKLVYYGPGLCGKTTNLEKIYANPKLDNKGKMISMATETDRTLFFDFMPMELGTIGGQKVRVQLYTVPGQVFYDATRKLVLRGADGVVFVADSQKSMRESNLDSLENLKTNLRINRLDPEKVAIVFQYNKRDLPNAESVEEMSAYLKPNGAPVVEASAINGTGVTATLRAAVARILENLKNNVDTSLPDAPELEAPDMTARSGVTSGSAGTPKLAMKSEPGARPKVVDIPKSTVASKPMPVPKAAEEGFSGAGLIEPEEEIAEVDPFAVAPEPDSPFAVSEPEPSAADLGESPFGEPEEPLGAYAESPFVAEAVEPDSPFAAVEEGLPEPPAVTSADVQAAYARARQLVHALEAALADAREQERALAAMLGQ